MTSPLSQKLQGQTACIKYSQTSPRHSFPSCAKQSTHTTEDLDIHKTHFHIFQQISQLRNESNNKTQHTFFLRLFFTRDSSQFVCWYTDTMLHCKDAGGSYMPVLQTSRSWWCLSRFMNFLRIFYEFSPILLYCRNYSQKVLMGFGGFVPEY